MAAAGVPRRVFISAAAAASAGLQSVIQAQPRVAGSAKKQPIRIGQIGTGHAHATKLLVYRSSPDYEVVGIVEPSAELRKVAEQQPAFQGLRWMTQEELLNQPGLQAVLVETQVRDSLAAAAACIQAGCHVHLDKPAGESLPVFEKLLADATAKGLLLQMGYMYRYNPGFQLLRQLLQQGLLGDVFEVHTVMSKVVGADDRRKLAEYSGGMLFELGCHVLDQVIGILGPPEKVHPFPRHSAANGDGLLDNMLAVLEYPQAIATVKSSALEVDGFSRRHFTVCGTRGTLHLQPLDAPTARLSLDAPHGTWKAGTQDIALPKYTRYVDDAADMARIIRKEKPTDYPPHHDLAVQRTLLQACGVAPGSASA
ncbi:MAG: hypothetical protein RLZZ458_3770 [Planctomycetota bacterium]